MKSLLMLMLVQIKPSIADSSLFVQKFGSKLTIIVVYIDDIIITGNDSYHCNAIITHLGLLLHLKDLGYLHYFLGLEVKRNPTVLFLCQTKYAIKLLYKTNLAGVKPCNSPCPENFKLSTSAGDLTYLT